MGETATTFNNNMNATEEIHTPPASADTDYLESLPIVDMETFEREKGLLPPLPQLLTKIDSLLRSGSTEVQTVTEAIIAEPTVVARILRVVNSAFYGLPREISDIKHAVAFLGFKEIHRIVLTCSVAETFRDANPVLLKRYWTHSYFTALISSELARTYDRHLDPGVLWPAALLHDLGELVYMRLFSDQYAALVRYRNDHGCLLDDAESALGLPSHGAMGGELCEQWKLPSTVQDVCRYHNSPENVPPGATKEIESLRRIVSAADYAASLTTDDLSAPVQEEVGKRVMEGLGCSESDLLRILAVAVELRGEVERLTAD